jgi:hypothetical protein
MAWAKHSGNKPDSHAAATTLTFEPANIEFRCVTKRFGEIVAADHIDLRISAGEFLSLLGPPFVGTTAGTADVRLWHLADIHADDEHVCLWG